MFKTWIYNKLCRVNFHMYNVLNSYCFDAKQQQPSVIIKFYMPKSVKKKCAT